MNEAGLVVLPPGVVTVTSTTPVPAGVVTLSVVGPATENVADVLPNFTSVAPAR